MTVKELDSHKYICFTSESAVEQYNNLTEEQKKEAYFFVAVIKSEELNDEEFEPLFSLPSESTPEEAVKYVDRCSINEVECDTILVMVYPEGKYGYRFVKLANVNGYLG